MAKSQDKIDRFYIEVEKQDRVEFQIEYRRMGYETSKEAFKQAMEALKKLKKW